MSYRVHDSFSNAGRAALAACVLLAALATQGCLQQSDEAGGELDGVWMLAFSHYHETYGEYEYADTLAPDTANVYMRQFFVISGEALFTTLYADDNDYMEGSGAYLTRLRKIGAGRWVIGTDDTVSVKRNGNRLSLEYSRSGKEYDVWVEDSVSYSRYSLTELVAYKRSFPPPEWYAPPPSENEPNNTRETAIPMAVGSSTMASLTYDDVDWFSFQAVAGKRYRIETGGNLDTYLELYGSADTPLEEDDDDGSNANGLVEWDCTVSGTYHVKVRGFSTVESGPYTISIALAEPISTPAGGTASLQKKSVDPSPKAIRLPLNFFKER
jgi:hypothetical protein